MTDGRSRGFPAWSGVAALLLLPGIAFLGTEVLQRHRFERMREGISAAVYTLDGTKLARDAWGVSFLPDGAVAEARYKAGHGYNLEESDRWMMWSLSAMPLDTTKRDEFWPTATVVVLLRQQRRGFLRTPRVSVIMPRPPQFAIAARMDSLLKGRGIEYEHATDLH